MKKKLLCGILSLLMFVLTGCSKENKTLIETEQGVDSVSIKHVEAATINIDGTDYKEGVYTRNLVLNDFIVTFEVTIGGNGFEEIRMIHEDDEVFSMYPLLQPVFEEIAYYVITNQSLNDVPYSEDSKYTASIILNAIKSALEDAEATSGNTKKSYDDVSFVSEKNISDSSIEETIVDKSSLDWKTLYCDYLKKDNFIYNCKGFSYQIIDINEDTIPELFFCYEYGSGSTQMIYINGNGTVEDKLGAFAWDNTRVFCADESVPNSHLDWVVDYNVETGNYERVFFGSYHWDIGYDSDGNEFDAFEYEIDEMPCSHEEYYSQLNLLGFDAETLNYIHYGELHWTPDMCPFTDIIMNYNGDSDVSHNIGVSDNNADWKKVFVNDNTFVEYNQMDWKYVLFDITYDNIPELFLILNLDNSVRLLYLTDNYSSLEEMWLSSSDLTGFTEDFLVTEKDSGLTVYDINKGTCGFTYNDAASISYRDGASNNITVEIEWNSVTFINELNILNTKQQPLADAILNYN